MGMTLLSSYRFLSVRVALRALMIRCCPSARMVNTTTSTSRVDLPMRISRNSECECASSIAISANGSSNAKIASSKRTPCFLRLARALIESHSKLNRTFIVYTAFQCPGLPRRLLGLERLDISPGPSQLLLQLWQIYFGRVVDDLIRFVRATPSTGDRLDTGQPIQGLLAGVVSGDCEFRFLHSRSRLVIPYAR